MKKALYTLTVSILTLAPAVLMAQPNMPSAPTQAPIDGGLSLVALAGGAYAVSRLRKGRK